MIDELTAPREDLDRRAKQLASTRKRLNDLIVEATSRLRAAVVR